MPLAEILAGAVSRPSTPRILRHHNSFITFEKKSRGIMHSLYQDLRYGIRQLLNSPGFTTVAVLSLALGIGANTALFSLVDAVLLKMLPVKKPEQLILLKWAKGPRTISFSHNGTIHLKPGDWVEQRHLLLGSSLPADARSQPNTFRPFCLCRAGRTEC